MRIKNQKKHRILWTIIFFLLVSAIIVGAVHFKNSGTVVPQAISDKLNFRVILPVSSQQDSTIDKTSFKYDDSKKVLSFIGHSDGTKISISEQTYPEILIYDKLVGTLNQYAEIQTKIGRVALTRPKSLNGAQTAVLSTYNGTSGVLLFAKPDKDLTNDQWTQFFNNLTVSS